MNLPMKTTFGVWNHSQNNSVSSLQKLEITYLFLKTEERSFTTHIHAQIVKKNKRTWFATLSLKSCEEKKKIREIQNVTITFKKIYKQV